MPDIFPFSIHLNKTIALHRGELTKIMDNLTHSNSRDKYSSDELTAAIRTAFVAKFILLREGKRSKAHRDIEKLCWRKSATADELFKLFRDAFKTNGDKLPAVVRLHIGEPRSQ